MNSNLLIIIGMASIGLLISILYIFFPKYRRFAGVSARIFIGLVFLFSGFVKAVDPLGAQYKITDYLMAFGLDWLVPLSIFFAIVLNLAEFLIGFVLVFGIKMRLFAWGSFLFMLFFTPLTLYLALQNPVSDCGCFGDAWVMTNWETFYKNTIFMTMATIVFIHRYRYWERMIPVAVKNAIVVTGVVIGVGLQLYAIRYDAILDFRPWKVGNHISTLVVPTPEKSEIYLIYKNTITGETEEYTSQTLPWQDEEKMASLEFIEQRKVIIKPFIEAPIHDFMIINNEGYNMTDELITYPQFHFLAVSYDLAQINENAISKLTLFANACHNNNINFHFITGSTPTEVDAFIEANNPSYNIYNADPTALKTIIRSNPGLLILKEGFVVDKWAHRRIPEYSTFKSNIEVYENQINEWKKAEIDENIKE